MTIKVLDEAAKEFEDAVTYYDEKQPGLGHRLRDELDAHVRWIRKHPNLPRLRAGGYRRVNLRVFPFYVAYVIRDQVIWVVAIANAYRKPHYWIGRL